MSDSAISGRRYMASSLLDALKKSGLVKKDHAAQIEYEKREKLKEREEASRYLASLRVHEDEKEANKQKRFLNRASKETTKASSRTGTRAYYDRFK